ncbi:Phosphoglycerate mutase-like protein [Mycena indigotica]|uniref:Phosphoglycerate mutase-like protein n=1 Tax=Mycena indigotica TaxID=2126181 RepID=A0A8H6VU67_9AGAR|nr:Phosphoglycerate mutase-like protein [Mycena indigotica]KAF7292081.1 Phosphoglycerate mutase-like protein [Mycena indigotica]
MGSHSLLAWAFVLPSLIHATSPPAGITVSSFAGATTTFAFPPAGQTITVPDPAFPDGEQVGFPGPTPTGDEAIAIATAPSIAKFTNVFPLINPATSNPNSKAPFDVLHHFGNLAPWQSLSSAWLSARLANASPKIPAGCQLDQVHLVHRHGARYPTTGAPPSAFAAALHAVAQAGNLTVTGPLSFLATWEYKLGAEILTPFGRSQLFDLGVGFRVKYGDLLKGFTKLPVWRTTSQGRMLDSALHFAAGFFGVQTYQQDYHQLIQIEQLGFNSTLSPYYDCTNGINDHSNFGTTQALKWANVYLAPAVKRLQPFIKGLPLTPSILFAMQQLCAYETVALGYSTFCPLFTDDEWTGYSYGNDLAFWYSFGPGNPTTSAQGIGYAQELLSRLTQTRITKFDTSINASIATNETLFPFGQPIYVDATHDTIISAILTAMNFTALAAEGPLPTDHIPPNHVYIVNNVAPFASNIVTQVLTCPAPATPSANTKPTHIRMILNDAVLPLTGLAGCQPNSDGTCPLDTFVSALQKRIGEVDYQFDCFANYSIPDPDPIVNGQFPQ